MIREAFSRGKRVFAKASASTRSRARRSSRRAGGFLPRPLLGLLGFNRESAAAERIEAVARDQGFVQTGIVRAWHPGTVAVFEKTR